MHVNQLIKQVANLTLPCADDGIQFIRVERLERITSALADTKYVLLGDRPLACVYQHEQYLDTKPTILVSSHIDSLYEEYFLKETDGEVHGTLDNSASNAVAVELMLLEALPTQVLVAFTGNEEHCGAGADQTIDNLRDHGLALRNLELVITLDLTEESYACSHFTIENYFVKSQHDDTLLRFNRKHELKAYLSSLLESPTFITDGAADESWQYDEHDLNCFSLCLPCALLGPDMHSDSGVAVRSESLKSYAETLLQIVSAVERVRKGYPELLPMSPAPHW